MARRTARQEMVVAIVARALAAALTNDSNLSDADLMRKVLGTAKGALPEADGGNKSSGTRFRPRHTIAPLNTVSLQLPRLTGWERRMRPAQS